MGRFVSNWFDQNMRFCPYCFLSYFSRWYRFTCRRHGNPSPLGNIELNLIGGKIDLFLDFFIVSVILKKNFSSFLSKNRGFFFQKKVIKVD